MKKILTATAIIEGSTGIALLIAPKLVVSLLLHATLQEPVGIFLSRFIGIALTALSIGCWLSRNIDCGGSQIIKAMLFYNAAAALLLAFTAMNGFPGVSIWAVSLLHMGLAVWCTKNLISLN